MFSSKAYLAPTTIIKTAGRLKIDLQIYKHYIILEIIYKSNKSPSKGSLGLDRLSVLIRREAQGLLIQ